MTPATATDLHREALLRAHELRREALDDFWRGGNAVLATAASRSLRAAQRLAARLRRHQRATLNQPEA